MANNDLTTLSIPVARVGADLSYTSVNPKEYAGPSVGGLGYVPILLDRNGVPTTIKTTQKDVGASVPKALYIDTDVAETVTTVVTPASLAPVPAYPVVPSKVLSRVHNEGLPNLIPMMPTLPPPATAHSHPATEVYETKDRIWFTPDERVELREMYLDLLQLEEDLKNLQPKISRTIVFCFPDIPNVDNPIEIRFPWKGNVSEFEFNFSRFDTLTTFNTGFVATTFNVQRCNAVNFVGIQVWEDLIPSDVVLDATVKRIILPANIPVAEDDMFRINFTQVSDYVKNIIGQVYIDC